MLPQSRQPIPGGPSTMTIWLFVSLACKHGILLDERDQLPGVFLRRVQIRMIQRPVSTLRSIPFPGKLGHHMDSTLGTLVDTGCAAIAGNGVNGVNTLALNPSPIGEGARMASKRQTCSHTPQPWQRMGSITATAPPVKSCVSWRSGRSTSSKFAASTSVSAKRRAGLKGHEKPGAQMPLLWLFYLSSFTAENDQLFHTVHALN